MVVSSVQKTTGGNTQPSLPWIRGILFVWDIHTIQDFCIISFEKWKRGWTLTTSQCTITYFRTQRTVTENTKVAWQGLDCTHLHGILQTKPWHCPASWHPRRRIPRTPAPRKARTASGTWPTAGARPPARTSPEGPTSGRSAGARTRWRSPSPRSGTAVAPGTAWWCPGGWAAWCWRRRWSLGCPETRRASRRWRGRRSRRSKGRRAGRRRGWRRTRRPWGWGRWRSCSWSSGVLAGAEPWPRCRRRWRWRPGRPGRRSTRAAATPLPTLTWRRPTPDQLPASSLALLLPARVPLPPKRSLFRFRSQGRIPILLPVMLRTSLRLKESLVLQSVRTRG